MKDQYNAQKLVALDDLGLSEEELFTPISHDNLESEKITAPRYSYWNSVFRVFFKIIIGVKVGSIVLTCISGAAAIALVFLSLKKKED